MEKSNLLSEHREVWDQSARKILSSLGITANYAGFAYAAYAIALAMQEPRRLQYVTKSLYPEVARQYGTTTACVERCIRTVCRVSWERNPDLLGEIAHYPLPEKPANSVFLAILTTYLSDEETHKRA